MSGVWAYSWRFNSFLLYFWRVWRWLLWYSVKVSWLTYCSDVWLCLSCNLVMLWYEYLRICFICCLYYCVWCHVTKICFDFGAWRHRMVCYWEFDTWWTFLVFVFLNLIVVFVFFVFLTIITLYFFHLTRVLWTCCIVYVWLCKNIVNLHAWLFIN